MNTGADSRGEAGKPAPEEAPAAGFARRIPAYSRFVVSVPVVGLFVGTVALVGVAAWEVVGAVGHLLAGELDKQGAMLEFIEIADVFLLATVLYVISLGLYELFVDAGLPLPGWMEIRTLDDLKTKLVGVVVVVMGVSFLGMILSGSDAQGLMQRGIGIGAVILSLGYFVGRQGSH